MPGEEVVEAVVAGDFDVCDEVLQGDVHESADQNSVLNRAEAESDAAHGSSGIQAPSLGQAPSQELPALTRLSSADSAELGKDHTTNRLSGRVKSYSATGGFGFIICDKADGDVWFSRADLPASRQSNLRNGVPVTFDLYRGPYDGNLQARRVTPEEDTDGEVKVCEEPELEEGSRSGRIVRYNPLRGFGFVSCPGLTTEAWFPREQLPTEHRDCERLTGVAVEFELCWSTKQQPQAHNIRLQDAGAVGPAQGTNSDGRVLSYNPLKGFGFISCKAVKGDVWFAREQLPEKHREFLRVGAAVRFTLDWSRGGKPRGHDVQPQ